MRKRQINNMHGGSKQHRLSKYGGMRRIRLDPADVREMQKNITQQPSQINKPTNPDIGPNKPLPPIVIPTPKPINPPPIQPPPSTPLKKPSNTGSNLLALTGLITTGLGVGYALTRVKSMADRYNDPEIRNAGGIVAEPRRVDISEMADWRKDFTPEEHELFAEIERQYPQGFPRESPLLGPLGSRPLDELPLNLEAGILGDVDLDDEYDENFDYNAAADALLNEQD